MTILLTSISASSRYPTVSFVMSTMNGLSNEMSLDDRSSGSFPRIASRMIAQSTAVLQKGPSLSCQTNGHPNYYPYCHQNLSTKHTSHYQTQDNTSHSKKITGKSKQYQAFWYAHNTSTTYSTKCWAQCSHATASCRIGHGSSCLWTNCKGNHRCHINSTKIFTKINPSVGRGGMFCE